MTIDEAIDFLVALPKDIRAKEMLTYADALRLGIEALRRVQEIRRSPMGYTEFRLPGETKE